MTNKSWMSLIKSLLLPIALMLAGCGSGNLSTSGALTVDEMTITDLNGGKYSVVTTANFTPFGKSVLPGTEISYSATFVGSTTDTRSGKLSTNSSGNVTIGPWLIIQDNVPIILTITASTGGLSTTKVGIIPVITPLAVSLQSVDFVNSDVAGTAKTVAITGGYSPYTVASANPSDIIASMSGDSLTITKISAPGAISTSTTVTVTDARNNQQTIVVRYFR